MNLETDRYQLTNLDRINIILGKNGAGKSTLLRELQGARRTADPADLITSSYITPERGGVLTYEAGVEHNMRSNPRWMPDGRRKRRFASNPVDRIIIWN